MGFDYYDRLLSQVAADEAAEGFYDTRLRCCECQSFEFPLDSPNDSSDLFCPECLENVEAELALEFLPCPSPSSLVADFIRSQRDELLKAIGLPFYLLTTPNRMAWETAKLNTKIRRIEFKAEASKNGLFLSP